MGRVSVKFIRTAVFFAAVLLVSILMAQPSFSARKKKGSAVPEEKAPPYGHEAALKMLINPHEQINDEGEVLWAKCLICHRDVPDIREGRSIRDVKLRIEKEVKEICYRCHTVIKHPGAFGVTAVLFGRPAPLHMIKLPQGKYDNLRLMLKDINTVMPFDPATGKVTCPTCHNPHERGVLVGKSNWGADSTRRLRSEGLDICQNCHRK
jgi:hypothetical protein